MKVVALDRALEFHEKHKSDDVTDTTVVRTANKFHRWLTKVEDTDK